MPDFCCLVATGSACHGVQLAQVVLSITAVVNKQRFDTVLSLRYFVFVTYEYACKDVWMWGGVWVSLLAPEDPRLVPVFRAWCCAVLHSLVNVSECCVRAAVLWRVSTGGGVLRCR